MDRGVLDSLHEFDGFFAENTDVVTLAETQLSRLHCNLETFSSARDMTRGTRRTAPTAPTVAEYTTAYVATLFSAGSVARHSVAWDIDRTLIDDQ